MRKYPALILFVLLVGVTPRIFAQEPAEPPVGEEPTTTETPMEEPEPTDSVEPALDPEPKPAPDDTDSSSAPVVEKPEVDSDGGVSRAMLADQNAGRTVTNRYGMLALGAWALGNFGWATVGLLTSEEDPARAFHLTNAAWNLVNGTIAVFGYFGSVSESREELDLIDTLAADHNAEKVFLTNGALDVAYIFGGAFLATKGTLDDKQWMVGTGRSVMLQGAFLLAFDATMFTIHWLRRRAFQKSIGR